MKYRLEYVFITWRLLLLHLVVLFISSCNKGELKGNLLPETNIYIKEINLAGENRLKSEIKLSWSGTDKDGYIEDYEISFDEINWKKLRKRYDRALADSVLVEDSTFTFSFPPGSDTANIFFYLRAIDNLGARNVVPSVLKIPIKNSKPSALFKRSFLMEDTVYSAFSLQWTLEDKDGIETIDSVFIKVNNGKWTSFNRTVDFVSIAPENITTAGVSDGNIYLGNTNPKLQKAKLDGLNVNGQNKVYLKTIDISGTTSNIDSTTSFYLKKKSNDLLVINMGTDVFQQPKADAVYLPLLVKKNQTFDFVNYGPSSKYRPKFWSPTLYLQIKDYKSVFIYTNKEAVIPGGGTLLEAASSALIDFINSNGKLLISCSLPTDTRSTSIIFSVLPIDSISGLPNIKTAQFDKDNYTLTPQISSTLLANLEGTRLGSQRVRVGSLSPFYPKNSCTVLFKGKVTKISGWEGPDNFVGKTMNSSGKTNLIFSTVPLQYMNAIPQNLDSFFEYVFLQEFNW